MKDSNNLYKLEALKISKYLLNISLKEQEQSLYVTAMQTLNLSFNTYESLLWQQMLKSNWRMASIDAGLALTDPNNIVRRKLFTMLAILEASPNYTTYFLSKKASFKDYFNLIVAGIRAALRAVIGVYLIKKIKN